MEGPSVNNVLKEDGRTVTAPASKAGTGESLMGFDSSIFRVTAHCARGALATDKDASQASTPRCAVHLLGGRRIA